jgi:predicted esterase
VSISNVKNVLKILVLALVLIARVEGAEAVKLEPNTILGFDFHDLPDTLATMDTGEKQPARLTVQLPENYTTDGRFPLCVYLDGGNGGRGDKSGIARAIAGSTNFICVNLPLFKWAYNTNDTSLVSVDDFQIVRHAYRDMLQKLLDSVPNITTQHSAFGGFSNGAHTTALLIAGQDEFILHHFQGFYIVEGGAPLVANALQKRSLKQFRFLFLHGDYTDSTPGIEGWGFINHAIEHFAEAEKLDFSTVVMRKTGHDFPPKYMAIAGQWIRGEKLPSTEQKE